MIDSLPTLVLTAEPPVRGKRVSGPAGALRRRLACLLEGDGGHAID
jgi:hypothetical protein